MSLGEVIQGRLQNESFSDSGCASRCTSIICQALNEYFPLHVKVVASYAGTSGSTVDPIVQDTWNVTSNIVSWGSSSSFSEWQTSLSQAITSGLKTETVGANGVTLASPQSVVTGSLQLSQDTFKSKGVGKDASKQIWNYIVEEILNWISSDIAPWTVAATHSSYSGPATHTVNLLE